MYNILSFLQRHVTIILVWNRVIFSGSNIFWFSFTFRWERASANILNRLHTWLFTCLHCFPEGVQFFIPILLQIPALLDWRVLNSKSSRTIRSILVHRAVWVKSSQEIEVESAWMIDYLRLFVQLDELGELDNNQWWISKGLFAVFLNLCNFQSMFSVAINTMDTWAREWAQHVLFP